MRAPNQPKPSPLHPVAGTATRPAGIILGFVGYAKGDKPLGLYVGIGSIITMIAGMVLGAVVWSSTH